MLVFFSKIITTFGSDIYTDYEPSPLRLIKLPDESLLISVNTRDTLAANICA